MRLLLDTYTFMWWDSAPDKIPEETFTLLKQPKNELLLSLVSVWEMQIKVQLGKLTLRNALKDIVIAFFSSTTVQSSGKVVFDH